MPRVRPFPGRRRLACCAALAMLPLVASSALAQGGSPSTARFHGVVVDASTTRPIAGTRIAVVASGQVTLTDSLGRFDIRGLPAGLNRFVVFAEGFPRANLVLPFVAGETMERTLELDSTTVHADSAVAAAAAPAAQPIPQVTVREDPASLPRMIDFERRRRTGRGQYVTRQQIEAAGHNRLTDVVRAMRGVLVECGGGAGCYIRMVRAPIGCLPEYVVDGQTNNSFGPLTPIGDIEGIEVYVGASDVPGEFAGVNAGCGVVVIWTRVGPKRKE